MKPALTGGLFRLKYIALNVIQSYSETTQTGNETRYTIENITGVKIMTNFDLIFNNAGGITLQTAEYCHHFHGREKEAAQCVSELLEPGAMPECWDGNEPEHRLAYDNESERRGEYQWVADNDVLEATGTLEKESREDWLEALSDNAMRDFYRELFALSDQRALQQ